MREISETKYILVIFSYLARDQQQKYFVANLRGNVFLTNFLLFSKGLVTKKFRSKFSERNHFLPISRYLVRDQQEKNFVVNLQEKSERNKLSLFFRILARG